MGLYLVAYDIRDRNRWHKVHHMLIAQALPIQYSVFLFNPKSRRKTPRNPVGSRSFKLKVRETHGLFLLTSIVHL